MELRLKPEDLVFAAMKKQEEVYLTIKSNLT